MTATSAEVLKNMIDNIERKLDEHTEVHSEIKDLIKTVITKIEYTNGKVGELVKWRERLTGMATIITLFMVPIMGWALYQVVTIDEKIETSLENSFTIEPYVETQK